MWLQSVLMFPTCSMILIAYCKLPSRSQLNDSLFFHEEYRATAINVGIALFGYALTIISYQLFDFEVGRVMTNVIGISMLPLPSVISTIWIPYKIRKSDIWNTGNFSIALVNLECLQSDHDSSEM